MRGWAVLVQAVPGSRAACTRTGQPLDQPFLTQFSFFLQKCSAYVLGHLSLSVNCEFQKFSKSKSLYCISLDNSQVLEKYFFPLQELLEVWALLRLLSIRPTAIHTVSTQILRHSWLEQHLAIFSPKVPFLRQILDYNGHILVKFWIQQHLKSPLSY